MYQPNLLIPRMAQVQNPVFVVRRSNLLIINGGEGGIRSPSGSLPSISCRFYIAGNAKNTTFGRTITRHYTWGLNGKPEKWGLELTGLPQPPAIFRFHAGRILA
jgi:hypothetical protein